MGNQLGYPGKIESDTFRYNVIVNHEYRDMKLISRHVIVLN